MRELLIELLAAIEAEESPDNSDEGQALRVAALAYAAKEAIDLDPLA